LTILRPNFSENRFRFLLRSLRFDKVNTRTQRSKLAPTRDFLTKFISNCQNSYTLGESITIDEILVANRGRCSFIQYMVKNLSMGLKSMYCAMHEVFILIIWKFTVVYRILGQYVCSNKPFDIVKRLVEPITKSNRNLTSDNYFSSIQLTDYLLSVGLTFFWKL
jgi:hypothetical protein